MFRLIQMVKLKPKQISEVLQADLYAAQREYLANLSASEHYAALAKMYKARIARLEAQISSHSPNPFVNSNGSDLERAAIPLGVRPDDDRALPAPARPVYGPSD